MCIALNRTPSELEQTLTFDDYFFFVTRSAVEPFPSSKIDIAQGLIRRDLKGVLEPKMPDDIVMSWNKEKIIPMEDLPIEEQAKLAIKRIVNLRMDSEKEEKAIKRIKEKLKRMQESEKKEG